MRAKSRSPVPYVLLLLLVISGKPSVAEETGRLDPSRLTWSRATFAASKLGLSTTTQVEIETRPAGDVLETLLEPSEGEPIRLEGEQGMLLTIETRLLGLDSASRLWFDPATGAALQEEILETGRRYRYKASRFTNQGVSVRRRNPMDEKERRLPSADWSKSSQTFYPYASDRTGVIDAGALFYVVSVASLDEIGDRRRLPVFVDDGAALVEVSVAGREELAVDYVETSAAGSHDVSGEVTALRLALSTVSTGEEIPPLELLGLQGDVEIYLEPRLRIPLRVSGRLDFLGRVDVELRRLSLVPRSLDLEQPLGDR